MSITEQLRAFLGKRESTHQPLTVGEVLDLASEHGYGLLFAGLALPTLVPVLPPGTAAVIGLLVAALGLQRALGLRRPWLPGWVRRASLRPSVVGFLRSKAIPVLERFERSSRKRLEVGVTEPLYRTAALGVVLLGVLMFLPIPFFNTLPAMVVLLVGIGFLRQDGLYLLAGSAVALVLAVAIAVLVVGGVLAAMPE